MFLIDEKSMKQPIIFSIFLLGNQQFCFAQADDSLHPVHRLDTIVVTASVQQENIHDALASINVIEGQELKKRYINDLADALEGQIGIQNIGVGLNRKGISIRGMDPSHTLYLIDGQRINSSTSAIAHSDGELNWVPAAAIEQIEVVRGPMSSLYGSEALGGVVNVRTKKPTQDWEGQIAIQAVWNESNLGGDQYKTNVYLAGPIIQDQLGVNFWAEHRKRDALIDPNDSKLSKHDQQKNQKAHLGLYWQPTEQQEINLIAEYGEEEREDLRAGTRNAYYQVNDDIERQRFGLKHQGDWDWGKSLIQLYQTEFKRKSQRSDDGDVVSPQRLRDQIAMGQLQWTLGAHDLTVGQEIRKETLNDPTVNQQHKASIQHYGVFLQDLWQATDQLKFGLGLRGDQHEQFGWKLSPKLSGSYVFNDYLTFKTGIGQGYKAPTLKQLSKEFESHSAMGGRGVIYGNPDLKPETNTAIDLSLHFHYNALETSVGWFSNDIEDLIETQRQTSCAVKGKVCLNYINIAKAKIQGIEWNTTYNIEPYLHLEANYTYVDAKDKIRQQPLPDRSKHQFNTAVIWDVNDRLQTKLRQQYRSSQYQGEGITDAKGYTLWHAYANYLVSPQLSLNAGIENLTDRKIGMELDDQHTFSDAGRRYFAGLQFNF